MRPKPDVETSEIASPIGRIRLATRGGALVWLVIDDDDTTAACAPPQNAAAKGIAAYFAGDLEALAAIAIAPTGTTFQHEVWTALRALRPGEVVSYGELARRVDRPRAVRAVASANARNPIALAVPCHRVIGVDGHLTGFSYGLWRKAWLLGHEGYNVTTFDSQARQRPSSTQPPHKGYAQVRHT